MSVRKPSFTVPTAGAGRLAVVLNAGMQRKLAGLSLVSIDSKEERQGKEALSSLTPSPGTWFPTPPQYDASPSPPP